MFADKTLTPDFGNIDRANYFQLNGDQKLAYWSKVNQIKPTGLTPAQWVSMEWKDLWVFNTQAKQYIFQPPSEYPLGFTKLKEWETTLENMKKLETTDPRWYNDIVSLLGNLKSTMDDRVDEWKVAFPVLEWTARDITKKNLKDGKVSVDPTKMMTQKEYADLMERSPTLKLFWDEVKGKGGQTAEWIGNGQLSTPQDDSVIAGYKKTQALTTSLSNQINKVVASLQSDVSSGEKSTDKLDTSKAKRKAEELEGVLSFIKDNELYTSPFRKSIESGMANASATWKALRDLDIKNTFPNIYEALVGGLMIRWEHGKSEIKDIQATPTPQPPAKGTWRGLSSKLSSVWTATATTSTSTSAAVPAMTVAPADKKKKLGKIDLKDKYYRAQPWQAGKVLSLTELLSRR